MEEFYFTDLKFGIPVFYSPLCESTSRLVQLCARNMPDEPVLALYSFNQTQGRGQHNRNWLSDPARNIAISLLQDISTLPATELPLLNMCYALAVRKTVAYFAERPVFIKWPNDIFVDDKKICGLLLEILHLQKRQNLNAGIGINVNQLEFPGEFKATSLRILLDEEIILQHVIDQLLECIQGYLGKFNKREEYNILEEFNSHLYAKGESREFEHAYGEIQSWRIEEVDSAGRIILSQNNETTRAFHHGQVRMIV